MNKIQEVWAYLESGRGVPAGDATTYIGAILEVCRTFPIREQHVFRLFDWLEGDAVQFLPAIAHRPLGKGVWVRASHYPHQVAALPPTYGGMLVMGQVLLARPSKEVWRALALSLLAYDHYVLPSEALLGLAKTAHLAGEEAVEACQKLARLGFPVGPIVTGLPVAIQEKVLAQLPPDPVTATDLCESIARSRPARNTNWRRVVLAYIAHCPDDGKLQKALAVLRPSPSEIGRVFGDSPARKRIERLAPPGK